ncbi:MAG: DUF4332 domain-containing protein, partial [Planctomycetota bacterium]
PEGPGKTAIARFIRDSLIRRNYPLGMMSSSSGRVVWADRNGKIHCRREQDGTKGGRRTIEFESRGDHQHRFDWLHDSWIKGIADSTDASRALESIRIPESVVDGIITDTAVTSGARVVEACLRSGLTDPSLFASLPIASSRVSGLSPEQGAQREGERVIRDEMARIESELASYGAVSPSTSTLMRRRDLEARLAMLQSRRYTGDRRDYAAMSSELATLHDRIWQLRVRQAELSRWLDHLQVDRNRARYQSPLTASPYASNALAMTGWSESNHLRLDGTIRDRLVALDDQIIRWRRMLTELRGLRETIVAQQQTLRNGLAVGPVPLSDEMLRRERMNYFLHSLDHGDVFGGRYDAAYASTATDPRWPDEIDLRIESVIRQIDWLASHYDAVNDFAWYRERTPALTYGNESSLLHSLRSIRDELQDVRRRGFRFEIEAPSASAQAMAVQNAKLLDLQRTETWITASIESLLRHRESMIQDQHWAASVRYPSWLDESYHHQPWSAWYTEHLSVEVARGHRELEAARSELDRCVARATQLRTEMRALPVVANDRTSDDVAEIERLRRELAGFGPSGEVDSRHQWLLRRRAELQEQLGSPVPPRNSNLPLADEASQWLVRLSAGRLKRVDWHQASFGAITDRPASATVRSGLVMIDGRDESQLPAVDRALAALAVRMAAADLLARTGRAIPLVVESHRELLRPVGEMHRENLSVIADANFAVVAALHDYASLGRQIVVLTSDTVFADQVRRRGGYAQFIHGEPVAHPHQPLWQPHFATEHYAGPHVGQPAMYGHGFDPHSNAPLVNRYYDTPVPGQGESLRRDYGPGVNYPAASHPAASYPAAVYPEAMYGDGYPAYVAPERPALTPNASVADINRRLDVIWRESQAQTPRDAAARSDWHDGYYYAQTYTTAPQSRGEEAVRTREHSSLEPPNQARQSPFFLTVDSPIDQAPSVDAVAAARLRALDVTHINHLMQHDPNRLSDALGLTGVTAATIRRWQAECRLVCHVPQLRGFDARVLVGCGITDASQLASTDPNELLDRVEAFLATERGQRILLSGTSYELSRITSWIAAANVSTDDHPIVRMADHHTVDGRVVRESLDYRDGSETLDSDRYEYEFVDDNGEVVRARSRRRPRSRARQRHGRDVRRTNGESGYRSADGQGAPYASGNGSGYGSGYGNGHGSGNGSGNGARSGGTRGSRSRSRGSRSRSSRSVSHRSTREYEREARGDDREYRSEDREPRTYESRDYDRENRARRERSEHERGSEREYRAERGSRSESTANHTTELRFYLQRDSPVVDAPSIGNRMAEKLEVIGVHTVDDLLNSDPAALAESLDQRRVDAETVIAWQQQAALVCRIPMLRGHDAQLLVAAEVTTAEEVTTYDPETLLALIDPIARSNEGKRIIRGGKLPDLEEITDWITYAAQNRDLMAA